MAIKLKTEEGIEFSFDTVAEFMEFKKKMEEEEASEELTSEPVEDTSDDEIEVPGTEPKFEAGDKVRVVSAEDGTETPYHSINIGSVVEVVSKQSHGGVEVVEDGVHQYLLPGHFEKVEPLGKDANGEDLYVGDLVTGSEDNEYYYTNSKVDMEVLGEGSSIMNEEANIRVRIIGESDTYGVDSSKFIKLSDVTGEELDEETEFNVGDKVRVVGNRAWHNLEVGVVREITKVDSIEPKYNLSDTSFGSWANTEDIELVEEEQKDIEYGDIVYVKESITDSYGDTVEPGTYARVGILGGRLFVSGVLLENDSIADNLVLVAKEEHTLI